MATTTTPDQSARAHQLAQSQIIAAPTAVAVEQAFQILDPADLAASLEKLKALILAITTAQGTAAASLALANYRRQRLAAGITTPLRLTVAPTASPDQVDSEVRWATKDLWGPVNDTPITKPDGTVLPAWDDRLATAITNTQGVAKNLALDPARNTVIDAVRRDPKAHGWYRQTESEDPCWFCAMLATRGAVYRSEKTAGFQTHDHCECVAEPNFGGYQPSEQVQQWADLYAEATSGVYGMKKAQVAFRQAYVQAQQNTAQAAG